MSALTEIFGEPISSYSRAQAIEDGVLVDVHGTEGAKLFKPRAAITSALHEALNVGAGKQPATYAARLWDVFYMLSVAGRKAGSDVTFRVKVGRRMLTLSGNIGPGDDAAPVLTVGFPEDF